MSEQPAQDGRQEQADQQQNPQAQPTSAREGRSPRGFASMDAERQRAIARQGGESVPPEKRSFSQNPQLAAEAGRKGGRESSGNFARNRQRAAEAGRKGGQQSGGNFARDPMRASEAGRKARHQHH